MIQQLGNETVEKLAAGKMEKISWEIKQGKRRLFTEQQIKRKYGLK